MSGKRGEGGGRGVILLLLAFLSHLAIGYPFLLRRSIVSTLSKGGGVFLVLLFLRIVANVLCLSCDIVELELHRRSLETHPQKKENQDQPKTQPRHESNARVSNVLTLSILQYMVRL